MSRSDWDDPADYEAQATAWRELVAQKQARRAALRRLSARAALSAIPADWLEAALPEPCTHYDGARRETCGRRPTRAYLIGRRCWWHAPQPITRVPRPAAA